MLTILHTESSMGWGGQEIRIVHESLGMIRRGKRVIIAAPAGSIIFKKACEAGIPALAADFKKTNPFSVFMIAALIDGERPDIINTHSSSDSWVATVAAKLSKSRPRVIRTRHLSTPISRSFMSRIIYDLLPDAVMTTGDEIRRRMIEANRFGAQKIFSVPTGIDLDRFNPGKVRPAFKAGSFAVGMVGVLRSWKGHKFFLGATPEIMKQVPNVHFYIAGDGPQRENIAAIIREMSLQESVTMLGHREDIPEVMASLDIIVHPSYANEGVPQSILQAFAMEKPVIASDVGAIREVVIDRETGLLIPPQDSPGIAEKVMELYRNPLLRQDLAKKGRQLVEKNHSLDMMLDKIEDIYSRLLSDA